jgi:hypothetical protein
MGTIFTTTATTDQDIASYLRSRRTTTQAQVDENTRSHDADDFSATERFAAVSGH